MECEWRRVGTDVSGSVNVVRWVNNVTVVGNHPNGEYCGQQLTRWGDLPAYTLIHPFLNLSCVQHGPESPLWRTAPLQ
jgi:hypothetical protein